MGNGLQKKLLSFLWIIIPILFITLNSSTTYANEAPTTGSAGANATWTYDVSTKTLTISGSGAMQTYESDYDTEYGWRVWRAGAKKLVICDGITSISDRAFDNFVALESISFPNTLESIGNSSFSNNSNLEELTLPESLHTLGDSSFSYCCIRSITLPESLHTLGNYSFSCCSFSSITIPGSINSIPSNCFYSTELTEIIINEGVHSINDYAFSCETGCDIYLPKSLTNLSDYAFTDVGLETIIFGYNQMGKNIATTNACGYIDLDSGLDISNATVIDNEEHLWSGGDGYTIPNIQLKLGNNYLSESRHFTCEYSNNTIPGEATVVLKGKSPFSGTKTYTFNFYGNAESFNVYNDIAYYTGEAVEPNLYVQFWSKNEWRTLKKDTDYTVSYENNINECDNAAKAIITGIGNYKGTYTYNFSIEKRDLENENIYFTNSPYEETFIYTGGEIKPPVTASVWNQDAETYDLLVENTDYTISYEDNIAEGKKTAKAIITGIGLYKGTKILKFSISKLSFSEDGTPRYISCYIKNDANQWWNTFSYTGNKIKPSIEASYYDYLAQQTIILEEGMDYTLSYESNTKPGTATIKVKGIGNCIGERTLTFTISKLNISNATYDIDASEYDYTGSAITPNVSLKYNGTTLTKDVDFSVSYANNIIPGTASVVVTGKGDIYEGTLNIPFTIIGMSIENATVKLNHTIYTYTGSEKKPTPTVTLNGRTLTTGTDYIVSYENNLNVGTAKVIITGTGLYAGVISQSFQILEYGAGMDVLYDGDKTLMTEEVVYTIMDDGDTPEIEVTAPKNSDVKNLVIPATVTLGDKEYKVTSIGEKAFYKDSKLTSVTIGNNVESIESYAFYGCPNLKKVTIGNGIQVIGDSSFRKCTKLEKITLPKSVTTLGAKSFQGCKKLKSITIKSNQVVDIKAKALSGISEKAVIRVPKKLVAKYKKKLTKKTGFKSTMTIKK